MKILQYGDNRLSQILRKFHTYRVLMKKIADS